MVAKGHRVTKDRFARRSVSRDRLDSAEQKVSPIRKSQIELSSQAARYPRSNRDSSTRIKGKDRDKRSQVSCGTYSQPLNRVSLQAVCARVSPCFFFFFSTRVLSPLFILSRYYLFRSTQRDTHRHTHIFLSSFDDSVIPALPWSSKLSRSSAYRCESNVVTESRVPSVKFSSRAGMLLRNQTFVGGPLAFIGEEAGCVPL